MIAIVRYAVLKSVRERFLLPLLFSPAVFLGAPILGVTAEALISHRRAFPMRMATLSFAETNTAVLFLCATLVVATGGAAAFWVLRRDFSTRSVSFFVLSCRYPATIVGSAALFGFSIAVVSIFLAWPLTVLAAGAVAAGSMRAFALAVVCSFVSACLGVLFATLSPAPGTLLGFPVVALALVGFAYLHSTAVVVLAACVAGALLNVIATIVMERRCAV